MDTILNRFNGDIHTKAAVLEYLTLYFKEKIIERALEKKNTDSLADAILELENGFQQLGIDYGIPTKKTNPVNESR